MASRIRLALRSQQLASHDVVTSSLVDIANFERFVRERAALEGIADFQFIVISVEAMMFEGVVQYFSRVHCDLRLEWLKRLAAVMDNPPHVQFSGD